MKRLVRMTLLALTLVNVIPIFLSGCGPKEEPRQEKSGTTGDAEHRKDKAGGD